MVESIPGRAILLSEEEAAQVRGKYGDHELQPVRLSDGRFILGMQVLEEPAFAPKIPFLANCTTCRLVRDESVVKVRFNSEKPGDPSILDRSYTPADKQNRHGKPPLPERGDWSETLLYESVGRALSKWEGFETEFAHLFTTLLHAFNERAAHRAYGAIIAFSGRADALEAAAEARFSSEGTPEILKLQPVVQSVLKSAIALSAHRNRIAHGLVAEYTSPAGHVRGVALLPAEYATRNRAVPYRGATMTTPTYAYTSGIVTYFGNQFDELRIATGDLWSGIVFPFGQPARPLTPL